MKQRILAAAMAAVMMGAALTGCGNKPAESGSSSAAANTDASEIVIGGLAPLTGNASIYGIAVNNAIQLAVEQINQGEGVLGKKIKYISYDTKNDATEAVNAYNKLVQNDKIVALVGDVTSTPTLAVKSGIPMISATATAEDVTAAGPNVFRACFTDPFQGDLMANYASKKLNAKTAAIIYNMADDYSVGLAETFEKTAKDLGLEIVAKESYTTNDVDFKSQLTKLAAKSPDVFFVPVYYQDVALIATQARQLGIKSTLLAKTMLPLWKALCSAASILRNPPIRLCRSSLRTIRQNITQMPTCLPFWVMTLCTFWCRRLKKPAPPIPRRLLRN